LTAGIAWNHAAFLGGDAPQQGPYSSTGPCAARLEVERVAGAPDYRRRPGLFSFGTRSSRAAPLRKSQCQLSPAADMPAEESYLKDVPRADLRAYQICERSAHRSGYNANLQTVLCDGETRSIRGFSIPGSISNSHRSEHGEKARVQAPAVEQGL